MKVLIRIQKVYKNPIKRSWNESICPPIYEEDFKKRISMTLMISYLALILNFTTAIATVYYLLDNILNES